METTTLILSYLF